MIVLSFFERPVWCYAAHDCGDPDHVSEPAANLKLGYAPIVATLALR